MKSATGVRINGIIANKDVNYPGGRINNRGVTAKASVLNQ
jgi:hypothetical protein